MRLFLALIAGALMVLAVSSNAEAQKAICDTEVACAKILQVTPDPADPFPATRVGESASPIRFTIERIKKGKSTIIFVHTPASFPLSNNTCEQSYLRKKGSSCTVDVSFTPGETGLFKGHVTFTVLAGTSPFKKIELEGEGGEPAASLSDTNLNFGSQIVNRSSTPQSIDLTNTGIFDLAISDIRSTGDFSQTNDCPSSLGADESCSIGVTLTPTALGTLTGELILEDDAPDSPQSASLNGVGIAGPVPDLALSATQLAFETQAINTTSDAQTVTATNVGTIDVTITDIDTSGDFSQTNDCPGTLEPGIDCTINVSFRPTQPGALEGSLTITSDTTDSPQSVVLTGTGIIPGTQQASVSADEINFGYQLIHTDSEEQVITITNSGDANLTMGSSLLLGDQTHSFHLIDHCRDLIIPIEQSCTLDLIFTPAAIGTFTITLDVEDDASDTPQQVFIRGVGTESVISGGCSLRPFSP